MLKLSDFDYDLPKELIAQYPLKERDAARLLVVKRKEGIIEHRIFKDIGDYLNKDDLLILNDTLVLPSRINGVRSTGGKVEILLLNRKSGLTFDALIKPARIKNGEKIHLNGNGFTCEVNSRNEVTFSGLDIEAIYKLGTLPLPPYIKRKTEALDEVYYQTVYAKNGGSIASPTAGLHFTDGLIAKLKSSGVRLGYVTLHVGYATFKPVKTEDIKDHEMGEEYFSVPYETEELIKNTRSQGTRIIAVGTTGTRVLETYASGPKEGFTRLFIYPGYEFKMVDCILTNFHLPRTTLYMLVCAFGQEELIKKAYSEAIEKRYRFYSYGDAMLII